MCERFNQRRYFDDRTGEFLFEIQVPREDTALFQIHNYKPGNMSTFKDWIHEALKPAGPEKRPYYLLIDMSRMEPLFYLSYDDCHALTYRSSEDHLLNRLGTIFIMPPTEQSYFLYKALLARDGSAAPILRASTVEEAMALVSQRNC